VKTTLDNPHLKCESNDAVGAYTLKGRKKLFDHPRGCHTPYKSSLISLFELSSGLVQFTKFFGFGYCSTFVYM